MAAGLGEAASIAAFISLGVQAFDGCIKGFVLLSAAQGLGSRADLLACQLEWEYYSLSNWAHAVGLLNDAPELNVFNPSLLKKDYGLEVKVTEEEVKAIHAPKRLFGRIADKGRPTFVNDTAKVFSRRNNAWRKLIWGAVDAERFRLLIKDIRYFNKQLHGSLHPIEQQASSLDHDQTMRSILVQSLDKATLEAMDIPLGSVDGAVAASARLKQEGLRLNLISSSNQSKKGTTTVQPSAKLRLGPLQSSSTLSIASTLVSRSPSPLRSSANVRKGFGQLAGCAGSKSDKIQREQAILDGKPVLIEWKNVTTDLEPKLKHRVANVATFLAEMKDPTFHSLPCLGYFRTSRHLLRYAYVFDFPAELKEEPGATMRSLQDLLIHPSLRPSLNDRLDVALACAETVLQLHTAGWLHEGIRADNILFFRADGPRSVNDGRLSAPYVGGYEFARADNPLETTEDPKSRELQDPYRHPKSIGSGRKSYIKQFDLWSLGCILVELAYWSPLASILWQRMQGRPILAHSNLDSELFNSEGGVLNTRHMDPGKALALLEQRYDILTEGKENMNSIAAGLAFTMGCEYAQITSDCFSAAQDLFDSQQSRTLLEQDGVDDEADEISLDIQEKCVSKLKSLRDVA
ncbi:MAG: hypothetical protein OHK93_002712 [Ramalina farinacea]|uniref:Protein kinase domain-containing protein n=1 Tax=Ramalina farinacea TaxID=258253 RepID=A0AA43QRX0_9LECA|nr:hypothetical protein [Ramalina farinacea]